MTWVRSTFGREEVLDELLAELALHERVGGDLADVAGAAPVAAGHGGQVEEALRERDGQRVLASAASA